MFIHGLVKTSTNLKVLDQIKNYLKFESGYAEMANTKTR